MKSDISRPWELLVEVITLETLFFGTKRYNFRTSANIAYTLWANALALRDIRLSANVVYAGSVIYKHHGGIK